MRVARLSPRKAVSSASVHESTASQGGRQSERLLMALGDDGSTGRPPLHRLVEPLLSARGQHAKRCVELRHTPASQVNLHHAAQ